MASQEDHPIVVLTQHALMASEMGQWDEVVSLYHRRAREFVLTKLPPMIVNRLIRMDQLVQERARIAHTATREELREVQDRRRKLRQWTQHWILSNRAVSRFTRSV